MCHEVLDSNLLVSTKKKKKKTLIMRPHIDTVIENLQNVGNLV